MNLKKPEQSSDADNASNAKNSARETKVTSNSSPKPRKPVQKKDIEVDSEKYRRAANVGPNGTEDADSDNGPGGTGW